jgi:hypothetical protein
MPQFMEDVMDASESSLTRRISDLEARITALEQVLAGKAPPDGCRFCGERAVRLDSAQADEKGLVEEAWKCAACGRTDVKVFRPSVRK